MRKGIFLGITMISACFLLTGCHLKHEWQEATCTEPKTCSVGGETEGEPLGHAWVDPTCTKPKTCTVCGETEGKALGHKWEEATCTVAKTCSVCKETEGEALGHTWIEATCTEPKICSVCQETEGEASGHNWIEATCQNPKNCDRCGLTEGDIIDHNWVQATCQAPATCSMCGLTDGYALEHQIDTNGICGLCSQQVAIPLTMDNVYDYFAWSYQDMTLEQGGLAGQNKSGADITIRVYNADTDGDSSTETVGFSGLKDVQLTFDVIIDYDHRTGLSDAHYPFVVTQSDLSAVGSAENGRILSTHYEGQSYHALPSAARETYRTVMGTIVNYYYESRVELQSVSGYLMIVDDERNIDLGNYYENEHNSDLVPSEQYVDDEKINVAIEELKTNNHFTSVKILDEWDDVALGVKSYYVLFDDSVLYAVSKDKNGSVFSNINDYEYYLENQ